MAELMCHDALQFVARQGFERSSCHAHHGVGCFPAGGKGVDARLVEHVDFRHSGPGCDRHLFNDVEQLLFLEVLCVGRNRHCAEHRGHRRAALAELNDFKK